MCEEIEKDVISYVCDDVSDSWFISNEKGGVLNSEIFLLDVEIIEIVIVGYWMMWMS